MTGEVKQMKCLCLSDDLVFGSKAAHAARAAGYDVRTVGDCRSLLSEPLDDVSLILVDLNTPAFDARSVADQLRQEGDVTPDMIAIGPHVHEAKLAAARNAGWRVYTRSQFHADAGRIFESR